jgi:hypothetical protein
MMRTVLLAVIVPFVAFVLLIVGTLFYVQVEIGRDNSQWCQTLTLLTRHPVPKPARPAQNPARAATYQLFRDFTVLAHNFRCAR